MIYVDDSHNEIFSIEITAIFRDLVMFEIEREKECMCVCVALDVFALLEVQRARRERIEEAEIF